MFRLQTFKKLTRFLMLVPLTLGLAACGGGGGDDGGGGGGGTTPTPITSFELLDPTPGTGDEFGREVVILANGNIVVSEPSDSSVAPYSGAVHLYDPLTQTLIASIYGDTENDYLGFSGIRGVGSITALANNNFVIASGLDNEGGIIGAGSVRLMDGASGIQIGTIELAVGLVRGELINRNIVGSNPRKFWRFLRGESNSYILVRTRPKSGGGYEQGVTWIPEKDLVKYMEWDPAATVINVKRVMSPYVE